MFGRAGQLALPGAVAQLGLDGVAYAPPLDDSAPAESSPYLATHTEFCQASDLHPTEGNAPGPLPGQLAFPGRWETDPTAQQLDLWGRIARTADMLHRPLSCAPDCECHPHDRMAKCQRVRFMKDADIEWSRSEYGAWRARGLIECANKHACPYCGPKACRETASKLAVAFDRHMVEPFSDVWMLTLKIPHYLDEQPRDVVAHLYDATETFFRSSEWRRWVKRWGVIGRVRVLDVTFGGANGVHPHFHVALFADNAGISPEHAFVLGDPKDEAYVVDERGDVDCNGVPVMKAEFSKLADERERWGPWQPLRACVGDVRKRYLDEIKGSLIPAWERAVRASGARIEKLADFRSNGLHLQPSERAASYFTKWGLSSEIGATSAKSRNVLDLIDAIGRVPGAAWTYKQWIAATKGRTLVTGLTDVCNRLGVDDESARAWLDEQRRRREAELAREGTPVVKVPELRIVIRAHLYAAAIRLGWRDVHAFIDERALDGRGVEPDWLQRALDDFLWSHLADARGPPDD